MKAKTKSNQMTRLYLFIALFFTSQVTFGQAPSNFTGTWVLNSSKSGSNFAAISSSVIITQDLKDNTINLDITSSAPERDIKKRTESYVLDGKTTIVVGSKDNFTSTWATWSSDKKKFTITELKTVVENGTKKEYKHNSVYSLDNNGETMNITLEDMVNVGSISAANSNKIIMVFDKAN